MIKPNHPYFTARLRVRVQLIVHLQPCMNDIYIHIFARMDDYIATHPYGWLGSINTTSQKSIQSHGKLGKL